MEVASSKLGRAGVGAGLLGAAALALVLSGRFTGARDAHPGGGAELDERAGRATSQGGERATAVASVALREGSPPTADAPRGAAETQVVLVDRGAEPRTPLRSGRGSRLVQRYRLSVRSELRGSAASAPGTPSGASFQVVVVVTLATAPGGALVRRTHAERSGSASAATLSRATAPGPGEGAARVMLDRAADALLAHQLEDHLDPRGRVLERAVLALGSAGSSSNALAPATLDAGLARLVDQLTVPLPEEPVGMEARWTATAPSRPSAPPAEWRLEDTGGAGATFAASLEEEQSAPSTPAIRAQPRIRTTTRGRLHLIPAAALATGTLETTVHLAAAADVWVVAKLSVERLPDE